VRLGFREEGGFVGEHDRDTGSPLPEHISARPEDLDSLIRGMITFDLEFAGELDPVIAAAVLSFGFIYVHPFQDGNGRIHRYLMHHVLSRGGFSPPGLLFPVSAAILERVDEYRATLEDYSRRLLPTVAWEPTPDGNVRVQNDTADFYRYFDATRHAEFLYSCVQKTIEVDVPRETAFLQNYDRFRAGVETIVDMPATKLDTLFRFLRQNEGSLSKRARSREFAELTDDEVARVEELYSATMLY